MPKIMHQVVIEADSKTIFDAITTQSGLSRWWIADCDAKPEIGHMNEFRVEGHGVNRMKVVTLEPNHRLEWNCHNEPNHDWSGTTLTFQVKPRTNACTLTFEHEGWTEQNDFFAICSFHWARHLAMLAKYCESGQNQVEQQIERDEVRKVSSD